jgi:hypothetical protein
LGFGGRGPAPCAPPRVRHNEGRRSRRFAESALADVTRDAPARVPTKNLVDFDLTLPSGSLRYRLEFEAYPALTAVANGYAVEPFIVKIMMFALAAP